MIYTATQEVTISVSGESVELEAVLNVETKFKVHPGCPATLEGPAEAPHAETTTYTITVKSDPAKIYGPAIMEAVTSAIENSQDWLLLSAAEEDAAARDQKAEADREEAVLNPDRSGWWRNHDHYDRNGYCDNPGRGY